MTSKKTVVVFGATGHQGGSVARALAHDESWHIRGVTRSPNSHRARELKELGVELVQCDVNNRADLERAFNGAYAAYALTNFYDKSIKDEEAVGKMMADVAKQAGVQVYLWSSIPNVERLSGGKYNVPHFTKKAKVAEYVQAIGLSDIIVEPAFYYSNFKEFLPPKKDENGMCVFTIPLEPNKRLTAFDVDDLGPAVANIMKHPSKFKGQHICFEGDSLTADEIVATFSEVTGQKARLERPSWREFMKTLDPSIAEEWGHMFGWFNEFGYYGPDRDLSTGRIANPNLKSFREWLLNCGWTGECR